MPGDMGTGAGTGALGNGSGQPGALRLPPEPAQPTPRLYVLDPAAVRVSGAALLPTTADGIAALSAHPSSLFCYYFAWLQ